ncbi:hypothetical protein GF359_10830, partial [candidate division WOR-3 bacterium]|nr:hypothetical protein [candidate division WOR-3 bacterium]MBD3365696.1 hypothetical protein [candidate division WOR-3 bacterium]
MSFSAKARGAAPDLTVLESSAGGTTINLKTYGMWVGDVVEGKETFHRISVPGASHTAEVGKPMLPTVNKLVAIPATAGVKVKVEYKEETTYKDYNVYPAQEDTYERKEFRIDEEFYERDTTYPVEYHYVGTPGIMRDVRLVQLSIKPFRWNTKTKELTVATDITVRLDYSGIDERNQLKRRSSYIDPQWERLYRAQVLNFDDLYNRSSINSAMSFPPDSTFCPVPYLIVYADDFRPEVCPKLDTFIEWKRRKGFAVTAINLDSIIPPGQRGTSNADSLKSAIQEWFEWYFYVPYLTHPRCILFVGDAPNTNPDIDPNLPEHYLPIQCADDSHVPTFHIPHINNCWFNIPSDYPYSLLAGDDDYPDISIGRWCVEDGNDLETYVDKTLYYEREPDPDWDSDLPLLVAGVDPAFQYCKEYIRDEILDWPARPAQWLWGSSPGSGNDDVDNIIQLGGGIGIVNYRGHGDTTRWKEWTFDASSYWAGDIRALAQSGFNGYPVVYNVACLNGMICDPSLQSVVEAWTRNEDGGAVGALGASVEVGSNCDSMFDIAIFRSHFDNDLDCGMAINQGKVAMINNSPSPPSWSGVRNAYAYYWIGDPELDVWRATPDSAYNSLHFGTDIEVWVKAIKDHIPIQGTKVCIYDGNEGGILYHKVAFTDDYGCAHFPYPDPDETGIYYVTATNQSDDYSIVPACTTFYYNGTFGQQDGEPVVDVIEWNLKPVQPNLVRSSATISYSVAGKLASKENRYVEISIFDVSGRKVNTLASGEYKPGYYDLIWNGTDDNGTKLASGIYFIRMHSKEFNA